MARSNPLLWPKPPAIWSYWIAVVSVAAALIISRWPTLHLQDAPVSLFLCAVILTCVVRWSLAGTARDGSLGSRFLLLLPASDPFVGRKA